MTWLTETAWPAILLCATVEIVLAFLLVRTGRPKWIAAMAITLAVGVLAVVVERWIETDREQVEAAIEGVADALNRNDAAGVLSAIDPAATQLRGYVTRVMSRFYVRDAKITSNVDIKLDGARPPQQAMAGFIARVSVTDRKGASPYDQTIQRLEVRMLRKGDRWLVGGYEIRPIKESLKDLPKDVPLEGP